VILLHYLSGARAQEHKDIKNSSNCLHKPQLKKEEGEEKEKEKG
jgi:hypothetical protein